MPTAIEAPLLDQQICFALYSASRALTARYRSLLEPLGLTYPQYLVMLVLWESGATSVGGLGERVQLDSGTLSPLLRRLEGSGFVTRTRRAADERSVLVELTPTGDALRSRVAHIPASICEATGLDLPSLVALQGQVSAVAAHVRATVQAA
jgi:MarR family transcriptional regulator, organic hydroperoxide resistance regulator